MNLSYLNLKHNQFCISEHPGKHTIVEEIFFYQLKSIRNLSGLRLREFSYISFNMGVKGANIPIVSADLVICIAV